jgi:hypothetical protein
MKADAFEVKRRMLSGSISATRTAPGQAVEWILAVG